MTQKVAVPSQQEESKRKPKKKSEAKKDQAIDDEAPVEGMLRDLLKKIAKRCDSISFTKDDFESYAEAQAQLDALQKECMTEIFGMKTRLKTKFNKTQKAKTGNRK